MISIFLLMSLVVCVVGLQAVTGQNDREALEYGHQVEYDKLISAQKKAEQFTPGSGSNYIAGEYGADWLLRAISPKVREKWADRYSVRDNARKIFDKELDKLATIAAKKIPALKPDVKLFAFHANDEESKMKEGLDHPDQVKIYKIGLTTDKWKQEGTTSEPTKFGYIWASDLTDDHSYCHLYLFRLTLSTFGAEKLCRASMYEDTIVGCP